MTREFAKSIFITILIFGSIGYFLIGDVAMPDFSFEKEKSHVKSKKPTANSNKSKYKTGQVLDGYRGVAVYYNGAVRNVFGRNTTDDGYNLGLKYQCVEFVKRFYYQAFNHKMPDSYGHARDFFNNNVGDGEFNTARGMRQFRNNSTTKPKIDDLVIMGPNAYNAFGHLFVITKVGSGYIEFIQQNPGIGNPSRDQMDLIYKNGKWYIDSPEILGWLRI